MTTKLQNESLVVSRRTNIKRRWLRKALLLPAEHGSWSWLLVPFVVGAALAPAWSFASLMTLIGGLSAFLLRQPATAWLRIRQGRGRRSDEPVALGWTLFFAALGALSFAALIVMRRLDVLWLIPPAAAIFGVYIAVAQINRAQVRNMWMELAGAVGLAIMAPAAYIAGGGQLDEGGWLIWLLLAAQNGLGMFYVRLRIADTHNREAARMPVLLAHIVGTVVVFVALDVAGAQMLAIAPTVFFLLRAGWATLKPRSIANIKRFGFMEVGIELLAGMWLVYTLFLP